MGLRDVTEEFRRYRGLARLLWNLGMRDHPDSAIEFNELDPALFRALFTSLISRDAAQELGPNRQTITAIFNTFDVPSTGAIMKLSKKTPSSF
jgi:hypothetical protein